MSSKAFSRGVKDHEAPILWHKVRGSTCGLLHRQADGREVVMSVAEQHMLLVHDPENKARYLVPEHHAGDTVGMRDYREKKQSFLCMLHHKGGCRARMSCNQLHLPNPLITAVREFAAAQEGSYVVQKRHNFVASLTAWDPNSGENVVIAYHLTHATAGRHAATKGVGVQLCQYHATHGCRYGVNCKAIHTKSAYQQIRKSTCCPDHQGTAAVLAGATVMVSVGGTAPHGGNVVPLGRGRVCDTKGLQRLLGRQVDEVKVCARHLQARCVHGATCNNIHVCRQWFTDPSLAVSAGCFLAAEKSPTSTSSMSFSSMALPCASQPSQASLSQGASSFVESTSSVEGTPRSDEDEEYAIPHLMELVEEVIADM